jgi:hypothetical protein
MSSRIKQRTDKGKASTDENILSPGFLFVSNHSKAQFCNTMDGTNKRRMVAKYEYMVEKYFMMQ